MAASTPVALLAFLHAAVVASCLLVGATYYVTYRYGPENYPAFEGPTGKEPHGLTECEASTENIEDLVVDGSLDGGGMKELVGRHGAGEFRGTVYCNFFCTRVVASGQNAALDGDG